MLWRAFRKRREIACIRDETHHVSPTDVLLFATVRNEMLRLPHFLQHYRDLGVSHFFFVDNASEDGTPDYLADQPDVSLWQTDCSYKASRFGMDWITWLQRRYAHGHWTLTVDADELLVYPDHNTRKLPELVRWLDENGYAKLGALMLDLYPKGPVGDQEYTPGHDPCALLSWFDAHGYWAQKQAKMDNLWLQGGVRARCFFAADPRLAPTLNKIPLVKWDRRYVYVNSTHNALPPTLNRTYDEAGLEKLTGVLLHTKFLPDTPQNALAEQHRKEHFSNSALYTAYYQALTRNPDLWHPQSSRYEGWQQLIDLRLMFRGAW